MKRFILFTTIIFLILATGCSKSAENKETDPPIQEHEIMSTVWQLDLSYKEGAITEKEYHSNKVNLLVDPNEFMENYSDNGEILDRLLLSMVNSTKAIWR